MNLTEKTLESQNIYSGRIINLTLDTVELPDGRKSKREVVHHSGGAAVLYVDGDKVMLVKQFRYAYGKEILEIPAGKLEKGEDGAIAAARELEEETGYRAGKIEPMLRIYPTPGYTDEIIYIYQAKDCSFVGAHLDEGEFLNSAFYPIADVLAMIDNGAITDAKTITALLSYCLKNR